MGIVFILGLVGCFRSASVELPSHTLLASVLVGLFLAPECSENASCLYIHAAPNIRPQLTPDAEVCILKQTHLTMSGPWFFISSEDAHRNGTSLIHGSSYKLANTVSSISLLTSDEATWFVDSCWHHALLLLCFNEVGYFSTGLM